MKKRKIWTAVMVLMLILSASAQAAIREGIAAVVNDEIITGYELNEAFAPIHRRIEATYKGQNKEKLVADTRLTLLNRMIDGMLIEQEAKKSGIVIKDEEVNGAIDNLLISRNMTKSDLVKALEKEGTTLDAYAKDLKTQRVRMRLVRREINAKVTVADEEIGDYYRMHRDFFEGKEAVRMKQILLTFPPNADAQMKAGLVAEAQKIAGRLKRGEPFEQIIAEYAKGPVAVSGGDLGFIERGIILPGVEDVAFRMPLAEISDIIESEIGLHIISVTDKKGAGVQSMESVRNEIKEKILEEKAEKRYEGWIQELRKKSHVEIRI